MNRSSKQYQRHDYVLFGQDWRISVDFMSRLLNQEPQMYIIVSRTWIVRTSASNANIILAQPAFDAITLLILPQYFSRREFLTIANNIMKS